MGKFYLGHLSYNGQKYHGWQKQKDLPTIQETIFNTIRDLYEFGRIDVKATSRTDKGVHAFSQVVKMLIPRRVDPSELQEKINEALPNDLHFHQFERINKSFKVTYLSESKEYLYFFSPGPKEGLPSFVGYFEPQSSSFDWSSVNDCLEVLIGRNFFGQYQHKSDTKGDFYRVIKRAEVMKAFKVFPAKFSEEDDVYVFLFEGEGFLKQMVRLLVATLLKVGLGHISASSFKESLIEDGYQNREKLGFIAPANGLFLYWVHFPRVFVGGAWREVVDHRGFESKFAQFDLWQNEQDGFPIEFRSSTD
jgi:tRNA pseudouridine38-40 synthase